MGSAHASNRPAKGLCSRAAAPADSLGRGSLHPGTILLDLGSELVRGVIIRRPSARNKSPYVGDVRLKDGDEALVHMPSLDMGGKCVAGAEVLLKRAREPVGAVVLFVVNRADAVSFRANAEACSSFAKHLA